MYSVNSSTANGKRFSHSVVEAKPRDIQTFKQCCSGNCRLHCVLVRVYRPLVCGISLLFVRVYRIGAKIRVKSTVLGAFPKLRKANISFVVSVRPSVHVEQFGSHWTDFHKVLSIFGKSVGKIQVSLKCDKNNGHFT
jgi:hypothetical protein